MINKLIKTYCFTFQVYREKIAYSEMDIWEICLGIAFVFVSQVYSKSNVTKCYYKNNVDTPYYIIEIDDGTIHELACVDSCQCNSINSCADLTGYDGCWSCCCGAVSKEPEGNEAATILICLFY